MGSNGGFWSNLGAWAGPATSQNDRDITRLLQEGIMTLLKQLREVPSGGSSGQVLTKNSSADFDLNWSDGPAAANGLPAGGTAGQLLSKIDGSDYNAEWVDAGATASQWHDGSGAPAGALGDDGDYYLNNDNGDVYNKTSGSWAVVANIQGADGADGTNGSDGSDGSVWRDGSGVPADSLGVNGDYYLNNDNGDVYNKTSGTYAVVANIEGPTGPTGPAGSDGADGSVWRDGSGAPADSLGVDGDYYLNNDNGDVYSKAAGTYSVVANIQGADGADGTNGTDGADGSVWHDGSGVPASGLGVDGDYYLNNDNGDVYNKTSGSWAVVTNIQGADGSDGAAGADGSVWRDGSGAPADSLGVDGDYYLDNDTGDVYNKAAGTYSVVANIEGPQGPTGPSGSDGADGQGVPVGGTTGQVLKKIDNTDYNTEWADESGGGGGGSAGFNDAGNSGTSKTIDWSTARTQKLTLTDNCTLSFSNPTAGDTYSLIIHQDGTGGRTITWPASVKWPGGTAPTLSSGASEIDIVELIYDGTNYYGGADFDYQ